MQKIGVLGAGSWGLALGLLLNEKGHDVTVWCYDKKEKDELLTYRENKRCLPGIKIPLEIHFTTEYEECVEEKDVVVMAVPSKAIRATAEAIEPYLSSETIVVNVSKGIEFETLFTLSQVIESVIPNKVVVLSGPSHAEEVARHMPTAVVASSECMVNAEHIQDLFMTSYFRVYTNPDIMGVELGGALKNVIALAAGIAEGLGYGDNSKAALITRGITEIARLGVAMGGNPNTFGGLTGIGDLIVTCMSGHSRNRRCGELIGQGYTLDEAIQKVNMVVEGVPTTQGAYALMKKYHIEMPIIEAIYEGLFENASIGEVVTKLMCRDKKMESFD
ncbi:MAG: NAD(P)H-dependent glycerol-3-phosphate dehydrogenase [Niameybacter sp.]|uniref:NAD(P)H-dependent glycerol-3-phosphate dehydrogenase n=1 Tax=Niameybacter sp. TaxID=2033640 RepID=UPI002FCC335A